MVIPERVTPDDFLKNRKLTLIPLYLAYFNDTIATSRHRSFKGDDIHLRPYIQNLKVFGGHLSVSHVTWKLSSLIDPTWCRARPDGPGHSMSTAAVGFSPT